jgi:hypothetical protein
MTSAHVYLDHDRPDPLDLVCDRELLRAVCGRVLPVLKVNGVFNFAQAGLMTVAFYAALPRLRGGLGGPVSLWRRWRQRLSVRGARALRLRDDAPQ